MRSKPYQSPRSVHADRENSSCDPVLSTGPGPWHRSLQSPSLPGIPVDRSRCSLSPQRVLCCSLRGSRPSIQHPRSPSKHTSSAAVAGGPSAPPHLVRSQRREDQTAQRLLSRPPISCWVSEYQKSRDLPHRPANPSAREELRQYSLGP